jgi:leader peptidase (prepilin peptidase)/N-methyltransferase
MIALIIIDARHQLLPNAIIYPAFLFAGVAATSRAALSGQPSLTLDISVFFPGLQSEFAPWRSALVGGSLFAIAAPGFWLLDRLDPILFGKYLDWEDANEDNVKQTSGAPTIRMTAILGVIVAAAWAVMVVFLSSNQRPAFEDAYSGLLHASAGALISGGLIWCIRALYFFIRGFEGMGLGDIKMMSVAGAFLGFGGALSALTIGSVLGATTGLIYIYCVKRDRRGGGEFKTPLPLGAYLGAAVLIIMILPSFNFAKP